MSEDSYINAEVAIKLWPNIPEGFLGDLTKVFGRVICKKMTFEQLVDWVRQEEATWTAISKPAQDQSAGEPMESLTTTA